jgi:hypothetical protein
MLYVLRGSSAGKFSGIPLSKLNLDMCNGQVTVISSSFTNPVERSAYA